MRILMRLMQDRKGATAIEYALLAGVIGGALLITLQSLSGNLEDIFDIISAAIKDLEEK